MRRSRPISDVKRKVLFIGGLALDKKASDVVILRIGHLTSIADYLVICSGNSERHVKAIAEAIRQEMVQHFGDHGSLEGATAAHWILLDYQDIIVHVFREDIRTYYGLENMWRDAALVPATEYDAQAPEAASGSTTMLHRAS